MYETWATLHRIEKVTEIRNFATGIIVSATTRKEKKKMFTVQLLFLKVCSFIGVL